MNINYLSFKEGTPASGYWDMTFLKDLLADIPDGDRQVFLIPGAYQADMVDAFNKKLSEYEKVLVFVTSDEEGKFPCQDLKHPDIITYCQYGTCQNPNVFPIGYTGETRKHLEKIGYKKKDINIFFSGQLNSQERRKFFSELALYEKTVLFGTDGFSKGLKPEEYYEYMASSKMAGVMAGHVSPDSFRLYEALEAGTIPMFSRSAFNYTMRLFPDLKDKAGVKTIYSWWIRKKFELKQNIAQMVNAPQEAISVVVTTSPIHSHPSTEIIEKTLDSIRFHMDSPIYLLIDGVREEQANMSNDYTEYIKRLLWLCNFKYKNIIPIVFSEHKHQSGMIKEALKIITSPLLLFVEHDTPLVEKPIPWEKLSKSLLSEESKLIRFHYEEFIPEVHKHLMIGEPENDLQKTTQFSARPHLARRDLYNTLMLSFSENANCFIEDRVYTVFEKAPWEVGKLMIYHPEGSIKYSLNLDGRGDDTKYDDKQIF